MANNTPITARVNKGLFGKKSLSTTEPLLNVGAAGVSGNNQTRDTPSPSKMKSAFKMMTSPFKQTKDPKLQNKTVTKNPDQETTVFTPGGVSTKLTTNYDKLQAGKIDLGPLYEAPEAERLRANKEIEDARAADAALTIEASKPKEEKKLTPQPDTIENTDIWTKDKGDAQTSLERRGNMRSGKVAARQEKRATIKKDRLQRKVDEGGYSAGKTSRLNAKLEQAGTNKDIATQEVANIKAQSKQNLSSDSKSSVLGEARVKTESDKGNTNITNKDEGGTTTKVNNKPNPTIKKDTSKVLNTSKPLGVQVGERKKVVAIDTEQKGVDALAEKTDNGFFAKKSALKMKYFK